MAGTSAALTGRTPREKIALTEPRPARRMWLETMGDHVEMMRDRRPRSRRGAASVDSRADAAHRQVVIGTAISVFPVATDTYRVQHVGA